MKIASSQINMDSSHASFQKHEMKETFRAWVGPTRPNFEALEKGDIQKPPPNAAVIVILSDAAKAQTTKMDDLQKAQDSLDQTDVKTQLIKMLIEMLSGHKIDLLSSQDIADIQNVEIDPRLQSAVAEQQNQPQAAGYGLEYDYQESYQEKETTRFQASGVIKTQDGQEINFQLSLEMNREFYQEKNISIREGDAIRKDPLVINFGGTAAELTSQKFTFDLDSDGNKENISFVGQGSGFFVLDKNKDGQVNNGTELFGPQTGKGFNELAQYDGDKNGWIDENDAVYNDLKIWTKDGEGHNELSDLRQKNVGAIFLGNMETLFDYKSPDQTVNGTLKSSGIYVADSGEVGSVQQIDLAV